MLQYSLIRWVSLLLYSLQPVSFPQHILMPGEPKSEEACIGVFWVILIKLHLVRPSWFWSRVPYAWEWLVDVQSTPSNWVLFPLPCPPLTLITYMLKSRWGAHLQGVQSLWWQTQAHRHINLLELWEVHLAHHYLTTLVHCLTAPWWL